MKKFLQNSRGSVAIMMVLTGLILLYPIMSMFTIDTTVNKLKVYNIEDRAKAKLTAESGLKFAMARLRLYKEAYNFLQNNKKAKDLVKQQTLDVLWNFPFVYPVPKTDEMNAIQKEAITEFNENTKLEGSLQITINNISNKINLNLLRISLIGDAIKEARAQANNNGQNGERGNAGNGGEEGDETFNAESQLVKALTNAIEEKSEKDEFFSAEFYGTEVEPLVNELKYFVSDPNSIEDTAGADIAFSNIEMEPKRAPLVSIGELYTLPSWKDEITNLILNEFTVHGAIMIDLNKITENLLKLLIPDILPEDIEEFFKYKNDKDDPKYFNSLEDFKTYIVSNANLMTENDFTERFEKFKAQGLQFGPSPSLFRVNISASVERATYGLTAYVTLPAQPQPRPKTTEKPDEEEENQPRNNTNENNNQANINTNENQNSNNNNNENENKTEQITLLLEPRVVEILVE